MCDQQSSAGAVPFLYHSLFPIASIGYLSGAEPTRQSIRAWEALGVGVPFLAGLIASILVIVILSWTRAKRNG